jgi:serine/threonine-protein kinase
MTLSLGASVGPYKILAVLGVGGMGEVYRAQDTALGREVALKVLPDLFALDPERRDRFEREARLLASLNHPNIATLYGLKHLGHHIVLEMELVPGETLAERLRGGPMTTAEAVPIFRQITLGLEAAHKRGVVHRDLKPANVKVTPDGLVKLLDFGLAKALEPDPVAGEGSQSPTIGPTREGVLLGTAAYMSPEQVRGKTLDQRTDIWSFGCVLFEALAGQPPFAADTVSDTLASILTAEPDWSALATAPLPVRRLVRRCLKKDPQGRLRDIADARLDIEDALELTPDPSAPTPAPMTAPLVRGRAIAFGLVALAVAAASALAAWSIAQLRPQRAGPVARLVIALPPSQRLERSASPEVALAPDGSRLAYVAMQPGGRTQLYLRPLDRFEAVPVASTEGASAPFFSPDGRWIGFYAQGALWKISLEGGVPLKICDAPSVWSAVWGRNDTILFATMLAADGLWRVSAGGGAPEQLTTPDAEQGERQHAYPQILPDGRNALFSVLTDAGWYLGVLSLDTEQWRRLEQAAPIGPGAQFVASGHIVFAQAGALVAVPFDPTRLDLTGFPVPTLERMDASHAGSAQFAASRSGSLVYVPAATVLPRRTLMLVDRNGRATPASDIAAAYASPRFAPDGRRVVVTIASDAGGDLWAYDLERGTRSRLTTAGGSGFAVWTRDGRRLALRRAGTGPWNLFALAADGTGDAQPLLGASATQGLRSTIRALGVLPGSLPVLTGANPQYPTSWARDGQTVAFDERKPNAERDIWMVAAGGEAVPFLLTSFDEHGASFSPDGQWVAYTSDESGQREVYVQPYPGPGGKWLVSTRGGRDPVWSADGHELFYLEGDQMMVAAVRSDPTFAAGRPRPLFDARYEMAETGRNYDVSPDGRSFVMIRSDEAEPPVQLYVVINWLDDLKARTAAR